VATERVASILETLSRVKRALPAPLPLGLLRWLCRVREALETGDAGLIAHALAGAAALVADLREDRQDHAARMRLLAWLGPSASDELTRVNDRRMLEVAREWLTGTARHQIERRYLVDLESGEVFREESTRRDGANSLGPCPRTVGASLAEVESGHSPRRLRLLQYTTTPVVERESWDALAAWGQRDGQVLSEAFNAELAELGVLAEPFVVVVPTAVRTGTTLKLILERGDPLPLCTDSAYGEAAGVLRHFETLASASVPAWVAGRLVLCAGQLSLRPLAVGVAEAGGVQHRRV
jgi:hypothetical protein